MGNWRDAELAESGFLDLHTNTGSEECGGGDGIDGPVFQVEDIKRAR